MTYTTPFDAARFWFGLTGHVWAQQIKVSQIMVEAMSRSSLAAIGVEPSRTAAATAPQAAASVRPRARSARVISTIEATKSARARRQPSAPPSMPLRRGHATPV